MICNEKGLTDSTYYFFTPSPFYAQYGYYVTVCGHFHAGTDYQINRQGGVSPLLFLIEEGELTLHCENKMFTAHSGDLILLNCNRPHHYYSRSSCSFSFFHFDGQHSFEITDTVIHLNKSILFPLSSEDMPFLESAQLLSTLHTGKTPSEASFSTFIYKTLCYLQKSGATLFTEQGNTATSMSEVIYFIKKNIGQKLSLTMLAKKAGLSKYHFLRCFKAELGITPLEYISQTRIALAKTMLTTTKISVTDISADLGYASESSFINAFTRNVGISPLKYRRSC